MQRFLTFLWLFLALIATGRAAAVDAPPAGAETPAPAKIAHVALLLPLNSTAFGRAADAVKQGFMAASAVQAGSLPIKLYSSGDQVDDIVSAYSQATQAGARIVVGPLTKNAVTALAGSQLVSVPTLALNLPEKEGALPPQLYLLGLAADVEARQIAQAAFAEGRKTATIVASGNALAKRIQAAFAAEWATQGGTLVDQLTFAGNADTIRDATQKNKADMLFLAMDGKDARLLRPYLDPAIPAYATSQIYGGNHNPQKYHDLNGIRFIDMPWLLQPDHMAVMVYPRPEAALGADMERLYALGIDAWRLSLMLLNQTDGNALNLDGVTGQLSLGASRQFNRSGVRAEFRDGQAVLVQ